MFASSAVGRSPLRNAGARGMVSPPAASHRSVRRWWRGLLPGIGSGMTGPCTEDRGGLARFARGSAPAPPPRESRPPSRRPAPVAPRSPSRPAELRRDAERGERADVHALPPYDEASTARYADSVRRDRDRAPPIPSGGRRRSASTCPDRGRQRAGSRRGDAVAPVAWGGGRMKYAFVYVRSGSRPPGVRARRVHARGRCGTVAHPYAARAGFARAVVRRGSPGSRPRAPGGEVELHPFPGICARASGRRRVRSPALRLETAELALRPLALRLVAGAVPLPVRAADGGAVRGARPRGDGARREEDPGAGAGVARVARASRRARVHPRGREVAVRERAGPVRRRDAEPRGERGEGTLHARRRRARARAARRSRLHAVRRDVPPLLSRQGLRTEDSSD